MLVAESCRQIAFFDPKPVVCGDLAAEFGQPAFGSVNPVDSGC